MPTHYKSLIIVMTLTVLVFLVARPVFTRFMSGEDFARRRNIWLALTLAAFLIPNYWAYVMVAVALIGYGVKKDSNPAALYMFLLMTIPPLSLNVPGFGIVNYVFPLDHLRLLSLVLLLPVALQLRSEAAGQKVGWLPTDVLLVLYVAVQIVLMMPYVSTTATLRQSFTLGTDVLLPYLVLSRSIRSKEMIVEAMACFALAAIVLTPLAMMEFFFRSILYAGLEARWGTPLTYVYLTRGDFLRAQVTAGHSIVLGYAMAVAFGFWLYLQTRVAGWGWRWLGLLAIVAGLITAFARGPWVGAAATMLVFLAVGPNAAGRSLKGIAVLACVGGLALVSPWGAKIIDYIPFVGTAETGTITYRQQIFKVSWQLIQQHPLLGTPYYLAHMEELRQGEGIIDLVNAYVVIALTYGFVGLGLFAGFFGTALYLCWDAVRRLKSIEPDFSLLGGSLLACIIGALVIIATVGNYLSIPYIYWSLAGLAVAYVQLARSLMRAPVDTGLVAGKFHQSSMQLPQFQQRRL